MKQTSNNSNCIIYASMALLGLVVSFFTVTSLIQSSPADIDSLVSFQFDTYCPINSAAKLKLINQQLVKQGISPLDFNYNLNKQVYVVNIQARSTNQSDSSSSAGLFYCGVARKWWETTCDTAAFICSSPGPMFYFPVKQQSTIIWVNSIETQGLNWTQSNCYDTVSSTDHDCTVTKKPQTWKKCTYFQPTNYQYNNAEYQRVKRESVPISPHIHGLEIRPVYDGNPLSWFTAHGQTGSGYQSLHNPDYFSFFKQEDSFKGMKSINMDLSKKIKIIKVDNNQPPGLLFYHDHAMKSTLYNVQNGLGGLYVIYDPVIQASLPKGQYLKYIVLAKQGDSRPVIVSTDGLLEEYNSQIFDRSATYRFRMLNMAFDNAYDTVTFSAYYTQQTIDGKTVYQEIDPSSSQYPLDQNKHQIPFTVIGTDTTMFHQAINNINYVNFGPAQRIDLLIRFDKVLPPNVNNVYMVCFDNNQGSSVIKHRFKVNQISKNANIDKKPSDLTNIIELSSQPKLKDQQMKYPESYKTLNIAFTNLSTIPDEQIAVKRHRPLFSLPRDGRFMIGAHYMFEMGKTDRPKIGTIQDFYLINNLWQAHPMHIHLINHQVVHAYRLKQLPENPQCTLYFLDYFRLSNLPQFQNLNNVELCSYLWGLEDQKVLQLFENLKGYMPEDKIQVTSNGRINGLDVMSLSHGDVSYKVGNCDLDNTHKYICSDVFDQVLEHQRRWKDTSMVHAFTVFVMRIRWASTSYDPAIRSYPYFNIPEEQLAEFPGFVYHCHILPHEDNEMMRSISLQYSSWYVNNLQQSENNNKCSRKSWQQKMFCINQALGCSKSL